MKSNLPGSVTRRFLLQASLAGAGLIAVGVPEAHAAIRPRAPSSTTPLTVATYNIRYESFDTDPAYPERWWSNRGSAAAHSIVRSGAVLVALQEVSYLGKEASQASSLAGLLTAASGNEWLALEAGRMQAFVYDSTAIESKGGVTLRDLLVEHARPKSPQRVVGWAPFRQLTTGMDFTMANSHLPINPDSPPWGREMTWEAVATLVDQLQLIRAQTGAPVILGADFNDAQTGPYLLGQAGYIDPCAVVNDPTYTQFNSFNQWDPMMVGRQKGVWIDRIVTSTDLTATRAGLDLEFATGDGLPLSVPIGSDHFLMFANSCQRPYRPRQPGPRCRPQPPSRSEPGVDMSVITPWALDALDGAPTYDARTLRLISTGSLGASSQPLTAASGVLSGLVVSADFPQVNVSPGLMVVTASGGSSPAWTHRKVSPWLRAHPSRASISSRSRCRTLAPHGPRAWR